MSMYYKQTQNYFYQKSDDSYIQWLSIEMDNKLTPLHLKNRDIDPQNQIKTDEDKIEQWMTKELQGRYPAILQIKHLADG